MNNEFVLTLRNRSKVSVPVVSGGASVVIPPGKRPKTVKIRGKDIPGLLKALKRYPSVKVEIPKEAEAFLNAAEEAKAAEETPVKVDEPEAAEEAKAAEGDAPENKEADEKEKPKRKRKKRSKE